MLLCGRSDRGGMGGGCAQAGALAEAVFDRRVT